MPPILDQYLADLPHRSGYVQSRPSPDVTTVTYGKPIKVDLPAALEDANRVR